MKKNKFFIFISIIVLSVIGTLFLIILQNRVCNNDNYGYNFREQWGLKNSGQSINGIKGKKGYDICIEDVWKISKGSNNVLVGILDTGIQTSNNYISHSIYTNDNEIINGKDDDGNGYIDDVNGWDFYNNDSTVYDDYLYDYHGTYITSVISSSHGNKIAGIAPNIKIVPLKFMNGTSGDVNDAIKAIEYAHSIGVRIINCSWDSTNYNQLLEETMRKYSDILFICSSGKYKNDLSKVPTYPACFDLNNVICVTAINNQGEIYEFAGYGPMADVAAPGCDILGIYPDEDISFASGSSCATAYVTGIASLIKSVNYNLTSTEIASILRMGTSQVEDLHNLVGSNGIINAYKCIKIAIEMERGNEIR